MFTYGSLMFDPVWRRVVGASHRSAPARLEGYRRFAVIGETYPAVVAEAGSAVEGRVWFDASDEELARLDAFEDGYERRAVSVVVEGGAVPAWVYAFAERSRLAGEWDPERFGREHAAGFADLHLAAVGRGR